MSDKQKKFVRCVDVLDRNQYYDQCTKEPTGLIHDPVVPGLTLGRIYLVTSEAPDYFRITNDLGEKDSGYFKHRFEVMRVNPEVVS